MLGMQLTRHYKKYEEYRELYNYPTFKIADELLRVYRIMISQK